MRKLVILFLALALAACAAPPATPTEAPTEVVPTQTAMVVVETVVVTVVPTDMPTEVPSATPLPPPTEVPPTAVPPTAVPPTEAVAAPTQAQAAASGGPLTIADTLGAGWFTNITYSSDKLALRCQLYKDVTFSVKATDVNIKTVDFFYRIVDKTSGAAFEWQSVGRMIPDGSGGFTYTLSGDKVSANYRKPSAWLDFQFVGSNATGVIGRSEKIEKQINYMFDCP